jgi:hypothetical protein
MSENILPIAPPTTMPDATPPVPTPAPEGVQNFAPPVTPRKKFPLFSVILLLILTVVSVIAVYLFLQVRQLSMSQPVPSPSPSPIASADWQAYTNSELGFSFKYPKGWNENDENSPGIVSFTQNTEDRSFFVTFHKSISNIGKWLEDNQAGEIIETTTLNNNEFTIIKGGSQYVSREYAIVLPNMGLLRLVVEPFPNQIVTTEIINQILSTFKFTDSNTTTFTCPASGYVDCMPSPGGPKPSCTKEAMDWYKTNCPGFQGGAL